MSQLIEAPDSVNLRVAPRDYSNYITKLSAVGRHNGVEFRIDDDFAAYLAQKNSPELLAYLREKADEIRRFVNSIEARIEERRVGQ